MQNLRGLNARVQQAGQADPDRANEYSIALELQADCLAGVGGGCFRPGQFDNPQEVEEALNAAEAVGDDRSSSRRKERESRGLDARLVGAPAASPWAGSLFVADCSINGFPVLSMNRIV